MNIVPFIKYDSGSFLDKIVTKFYAPNFSDTKIKGSNEFTFWLLENTIYSVLTETTIEQISLDIFNSYTYTFSNLIKLYTVAINLLLFHLHIGLKFANLYAVGISCNLCKLDLRNLYIYIKIIKQSLRINGYSYRDSARLYTSALSWCFAWNRRERCPHSHLECYWTGRRRHRKSFRAPS